MLVRVPAANQNRVHRRCRPLSSKEKMNHRRLLAGLALATVSLAAHAEHFQYRVALDGTYSIGGTDGCYPPLFDQPACPRAGHLDATLSFDLPSSDDGDYLVGLGSPGVSNFLLDLGNFDGEALFGDIQLIGGVPDGNIQAADASEFFTFDEGQRTAAFRYGDIDHGARGDFAGTLSAAPEPGGLALMLAGLAGMAALRRRAARARQR